MKIILICPICEGEEFTYIKPRRVWVTCKKCKSTFYLAERHNGLHFKEVNDNEEV